jgi:hypothetical protein
MIVKPSLIILIFSFHSSELHHVFIEKWWMYCKENKKLYTSR